MIWVWGAESYVKFYSKNKKQKQDHTPHISQSNISLLKFMANKLNIRATV